MTGNFEQWPSACRPGTADGSHYVDFDEVVAKAGSMKADLSLPGSLIGSDGIGRELEEQVRPYPRRLAALSRGARPHAAAAGGAVHELSVTDRQCRIEVPDFLTPGRSSGEYAQFMRSIGLLELMAKHLAAV